MKTYLEIPHVLIKHAQTTLGVYATLSGENVSLVVSDDLTTISVDIYLNEGDKIPESRNEFSSIDTFLDYLREISQVCVDLLNEGEVAYRRDVMSETNFLKPLEN